MMTILVHKYMRKGPHILSKMQKQPRTLKPTVEVETLLPITNAEGRDINPQDVLIPPR